MRRMLQVGLVFVLGVVGLWQGVGADELQTRRALRVVDAVGTRVGPVMGFVSVNTPVVAFQVGAHVFALTVARDGLEVDQRLRYVAADCSGPAWMEYYTFPSSITPRAMTSVALAPPGHTLYVQDLHAPIETLSLNSVRLSDGTCSPSPSLSTYLPALPLVDLDDYFTPPFRVE